MRVFNKEQTDVLESKSERLLVSASAGSGKTTVMIEKIVRLVKNGASLKNMLVSTFTKASAADIRTKLFDGLYRERQDEHIRTELDIIAAADITNLHSWCQRQISQYFYRLGISPDFKVIDEQESGSLIGECLDRVVEEEIERGSPEFILLYDILISSRKDTKLREYVTDIYKFAVTQPDPGQWLSLYNEAHSANFFADRINEIMTKKRERFIGRVIELERLTAQAGFTRNLPYIDELIEYLRGNVPSLTKPYGKIGAEFSLLNNAFVAMKEEAKRLIEELNELSDMNFSLSKDEKEDVLARMAARLFELYTAEKNLKGVLDFSDLEHFMLKLLADDEAAKEICEKYKYIFVDEYQDINPMQETILCKVSDKSTIFYVGDIKQSIYAFRGCEPGIFLDKYRAYQSEDGNGEVISLNANYRSDPRILEFCNDIFSKIMTADFGGLNYDRDGRFRAGRGNIGMPPELIIVKDKPHEDEVKELPVYSIRGHADGGIDSLTEAEQNLIIRKILDLMLMDVEAEGKKRPVNLSDIVILVRSGGEYLTTLKSKLTAAGIEFSVDAKLNYASEQVTAILIAFLELIDNFDNDIALLTVMRSVMGGFSDSELARIRAADMYSEYFYEAARAYNNNDLLKDKLDVFFTKINHYYTLSLCIPVDRLLGIIVSEADYFKHVFSLEDGKSKGELLDSFLRFISTSSHKKNITFFLRHLKNGILSEACPLKPGAIRIMTVHASKGLEFPFVIFGGLGKQFNATDIRDRLILDRKLGICLKNFDEESNTVSRSPAWTIARECLKSTMLDEELRILYVALTRAEYGLFVFGTLSETDKNYMLYETGVNLVDYSAANNFLTWFLPVMDKYARFYKIGECKSAINIKVETERIPIFSDHDKSLANEIKARMNFVYPHHHTIRKTFVTAAVKIDREDDVILPVFFGGDDKALERGSAYHKAMELINFSADFDAEWSKLSHNLTAFIDYVELKTAAAKMRDFIGTNKIYKELPFIFNCPITALTENLTLSSIPEINIQKDGVLNPSPQDRAIDKTILHVETEIENTLEKDDIFNLSLHDSVRDKTSNSAADTSEKILIQGVIDALIIEPDGAVIVDYKTTRGPNIIRPEYSRQLELYSQAVESILKLPVKAAYLYFFAGGEFILSEKN